MGIGGRIPPLLEALERLFRRIMTYFDFLERVGGPEPW
jgi:hypothetical protein